MSLVWLTGCARVSASSVLPTMAPQPIPTLAPQPSTTATPIGVAEPTQPEEDPRPETAVAAAGAAVNLGEGLASYYGGAFHGRRTASGEKFDKSAFTAAHRSLRFGTRVCVLHLANSRRVEVRVNNRGPTAKNRIINLSEAAARRLGMVREGVARVRLLVADRCR